MDKINSLFASIFYILIPVLLISCNNYEDVPYTYQVPYELDDDIKVGSLYDAGLDSSIICQAIKRMKGGAIGQIHSILVYKNNMLVVEEYFPGNEYHWEAPGFYGKYVTWNKDRLHSVMSVTKSITSACIGIAIDKGFIKSVHQSIFDYLPNHQNLKTNGKDKITIEHLLTMTSGLEWTEWGLSYDDIENPIIGIWYSDKDPVSFILEGSLVYEPGTHFSYYGGNQILLGEILKNATGLNIDEFSREYLFKNMKINSAQWSMKFKNGVIEAAGSVRMKPRDMLKFGIVYLNDGKWNQQKLLSKDWIEKSSKPYLADRSLKVPGEDSGNVGYGYSWWNKKLKIKDKEMTIYWALGWGGQKIIVMPALELVVVFTGGNYNSGTDEFKILEDFIIAATG